MSSSKKSRPSKKSKKSSKKSKSVTRKFVPPEPPKPVGLFDEGDEPYPQVLPYVFRPASIKFRKKRSRVIGTTAANHHRSKSLPNIPIADEIYEGKYKDSIKLVKLTSIYNMEEVEVIDYRSDNNSEDENLQIWYEESYLNAPAYHSDDEIKPKMKPFTFADLAGGKIWLDETIEDTFAKDTILWDPLTRPYFDAEFELFKRQNWIQVSHERATHMPTNRNIVFKVLTKNRPRNILTHLRLGYCVTYAGPCPFEETCQNHCSSCGICRHQYHCSCRKKKRFGWCWHMHAAILKVGCAFKEELTIYVANSSRYMQLAHIRASCYDSHQNVKQMDENLFHVYESSSSAEPVNSAYLVQRLVGHQRCKCPLYRKCPECGICRYMYCCDCIEYENGNLCEHCHLVAMHLSTCMHDNEKGEFCYLSDSTNPDDEEDEQIPRKEAKYSEQIRQVEMIHERSNSISSCKIEAYLEGESDDMLCYSVEQADEEYCLMEYYGVNNCDCKDLAEAVVCPFCRICDHEMNCYCMTPEGHCCKHVHAAKRYSKVRFNIDEDLRYGREINTSDWLLLKSRRKRLIDRQKRRNRSDQMQNIDLSWNSEKKGAAKIVTQNQLALPVPCSSLKKARRNEACSIKNRCKQNEKVDVGRDCSSQHVAANVEIQHAVSVDGKADEDSSSKSKIQNTVEAVEASNSKSKVQNTVEAVEDLIVDYTSFNTSAEVPSKKNVSNKSDAENESSKGKVLPTSVGFSGEDAEAIDLPKTTANELESNTLLGAQSTSSTQNNPDLTDFSIKDSATNEEFKFSSTPESSRQLDGSTFEDADSKTVSPGDDMSESCTSHKFGNTSSHENKLEENLAVQEVVSFDDLKKEIQSSYPPTVKSDDSICKEGTVVQDICQNRSNVVTVELRRMASQSTKDTKSESEIIKTDKPKIDPRVMRAHKSLTDASTQTDTANKVSVSTQTSDIDSIENSTSSLESIVEIKKTETKDVSTQTDSAISVSTQTSDVDFVEKPTNNLESAMKIKKMMNTKTDVSTQTDPANSISVSTQTSDIDFIEKLTSNAESAVENKKKRKRKTQRKQLKQSVDGGSSPQTYSADFAENGLCTPQTLSNGRSLEISENDANEIKETNIKT